MAKGYGGNRATREALVTLGMIESSFRSSVDREDGGMTIAYKFPSITFTMEIEPNGNLVAEAWDLRVGMSLGAGYAYDELDALTPSGQAKRGE